MMAFLPIGETLKQGSWRGPAKGVYLSLRVEKVLEEILPRLQSPEATADGGQAKLFPSADARPKMHSLREGKLSLLTPSPTISQEVYLYAEVLKRRINEALGGRAVEEVKLKIQSSKCKVTITTGGRNCKERSDATITTGGRNCKERSDATI